MDLTASQSASHELPSGNADLHAGSARKPQAILAGTYLGPADDLPVTRSEGEGLFANNRWQAPFSVVCDASVINFRAMSYIMKVALTLRGPAVLGP
jgi:hypothetical protein